MSDVIDLSSDSAVYKTLIESTKAIPWKIDWQTMTFVYIGPQIEPLLGWDGRIVAVGADVAIPGDARRIDGGGKVVTPGFFHAQSALGLGVGRSLAEESDEEYTAIGGTTDGGQSGEINASFNVLAGVDPNGIAFPVARMGGITTAVVMPSGGLIAGQTIVLRLAGHSSGEMLVGSPVGMVVDLSDGSRSAGGGSRAGALARLRSVLQDAAELRRRPADWSQNRIQPLGAPARELEALYPVLDGSLPVYVQARRQSDIETAVQLAQEISSKGSYRIRRIFSPCIMQFVQPDRLIPQPSNPQSLNRYAYVFNNPILYNDPSGHKACTDDGYCGKLSDTSYQKHIYSNAIKNVYDWNPEGNWSLKELETIYQTGRDIERYVDGLTGGKGLAWMNECLGGVSIFHGEAGRGSSSWPWKQIYLGKDWVNDYSSGDFWAPKQLFAHELGHTWDMSSGNYSKRQMEMTTVLKLWSRLLSVRVWWRLLCVLSTSALMRLRELLNGRW